MTLLKRTAATLLAGYLAGVLSTYTLGASVGRMLLHTGGQLVQLDGDVPLLTAQEIGAFLEAEADRVVSERVVAVLGKRGMR